VFTGLEEVLMPLLPGQDVRSSPDFTDMRKGDVPFLNINTQCGLKKEKLRIQ
jgi:hypothetical protein